VDLKGRRELHRIVAAQAVFSGEHSGLSHQPDCYLNDDELRREIDVEIVKGDRGSLGRDKTASLLPCHSGHRLSQRDPHDRQQMAGGGCSQRLHPGRTDFLSVSFDDRASVEEVGRHR
jgi:hypothetical protein